MKSARHGFLGIDLAALGLLFLTAVAPWLSGTWAVGRFPALCLSPGLAVLLLFARGIWQHPARALAASLLISAALSPLTLFLFLRLTGSADRSLLAHSVLWSLLLAAAYLAGHAALRRSSLWHSSPRDVLLLTGAVFLLALPLLLNDELRHRSDAWTHIALVREILLGTYPWTDPRFVEEPLRYFWAYNLWAAGFSAREGLGYAGGLVCTNLASLAAYAAAVLALVQRFFPSRRTRAAALLVSIAGLNPLGLLAVPIRVARGLVGNLRGAAELNVVAGPDRFLGVEVMHTLTPYGTSFVAWLDKYLVVTAFGVGMAGAVFLSLLVWEAARTGKLSKGTLFLAALVYAAVLLQHLVAAAFIGLVLGGAVVGARLAGRSRLRWPDLLRLFAVLLGVTAALAPYWGGILFGGEAGGEDAYGLGLERVWIATFLTTVGFLVILLILGRGRLALALRGAGAAFAIFVSLSVALMLFVRMPTVNENKIIILFFCMAAPFGAPGALRLKDRLWTRRSGRLLGSVLFGSAVLVPGLIWFGFLVQPVERIAPEVQAACDWLRHETPAEGVLIEPPGRRLLLNRAERDMFVSEFPFVLQCGYPRRKMADRIALVDRIYSGRELDPEQASILKALRRPVFVFYEGERGRAEILPDPSPDQFEPVFLRGNTRIYRWKEEASAGSPGGARVVGAAGGRSVTGGFQG